VKVTETTLGLFELIKEDWETHFKDWKQCGFRAVAVYRFGVWADTLKNRIIRTVTMRVYWFFSRWIRNYYGIELLYTAKIGRRFLIGHQGGIVIHPNAVFGDDCLIRQGVTVGDSGRGSDGSAPRMGDEVHVGAGAVIMGNITVGSRVSIGPNAVIMANVPAGSTAFGNPARIIKTPKPHLKDETKGENQG
jgi:serine O-acetyltransferase